MKCDYCKREIEDAYYDYRGGICNRIDCFEFGSALERANEIRERLEAEQRNINFIANQQIEIKRLASKSILRVKKETETLGCEYSDQVNEQLDYENNLTI